MAITHTLACNLVVKFTLGDAGCTAKDVCVCVRVYIVVARCFRASSATRLYTIIHLTIVRICRNGTERHERTVAYECTADDFFEIDMVAALVRLYIYGYLR